jgi:hypothetical protein
MSLARRMSTQPTGADPRPSLAGVGRGIQQGGMQSGGATARQPSTPFDVDEPDYGYKAEIRDADREADELEQRILERKRRRRRGGAAKKALLLAKRRRRRVD